MTVLGKVAVPKPINLPSQRLENHGMDPNVEIVPKGSLSWGARSSSSGSNAWGSSALSPRTEGGSASPSHLGRPSSGGGTRPSTAGSERTLDSTSNLWTSNSRPSSASGTLASNNTSMMSLRPHSAENRPGSSLLSRFAEPLAEGTATWGASSSGDKMGMATSANDEFSLSSQDFPTLGSEKDSGNNMESLDHNSCGHPDSSSSGPSTEKMDAAPGDYKNGMVNFWNNDGPQDVADGPHPGMERWHGDHHPYMNPNIPPPHYDTWRGGAPANTQGGVWFRGPPPGAPYGAPPMAAPGGFPMEPYPYYCSQVPAPGLVNSQAVPPHSAGPRGPHSKNGDLNRPIMEPFMHPGMPIRPGFYPGYYGPPPMGFRIPNKRDFPFMGVPTTGPPVYSRYPNQNAPEPINSNARSCEGRALEQVDCGPPHDPRRHYNVPAKQIVGWDKNVEEYKSHPCDKGYAANSSSQENFCSEDQDHRKDEQMNYGKRPLQNEEAFSAFHEEKTVSIEPSSVKLYGNKSSGKPTDVNPVVANEVLPRDHRLIQGRQDMCREEPYGRGQLVNSKVGHPINQANASVHLERHYPSGILVPVSRDMTALAEDKGIGSVVGHVTTISRLSSHKLQGRGDQDGRGSFKSQSSSDSPHIGTLVNIQGQEQQPEMQSTLTSRSDGEVKDDFMLSTSESCDSQRAKMKEIAKQRAIQRQKEEEERAREQKAKALAKLEELNMRSANQGKDTSSHKMDTIPSHVDDLQKQEESNIKIELHFGTIQSGELSALHVSVPSKASKSLVTDKPSGVICSETNQHLSQKESLQATDDDAHINDVADSQSVQVCDISSQKRAGYKLKNNNHSGKNMIEKPILDAKDNSSTTVTVLKEVDRKNVPSCSESKLPVDSPTIADSLSHTKRKNNRAGKNKHKVDDSFAVSSAVVQKETDASKSVNESMKLKTLESKLEPLQPPVDSKDVSQSLEIHPPLPHDDARNRSNNNPLKPQHARKLPRNSQGRYVEKSHSNDAVVWAPVRSHNKIEVNDCFDQKAEESAFPSSETDNLVPSTSKSKRAEMERYVPKAAMREPASQQGSNPLSASPSTEQSIPDGMSSKGEASSQIVERTGRPIESSYVESKPKQMQIHGSWCEPGSTDSNFVPVSGDSSSSMLNPGKNSQTSDLQKKTQKPKALPKGSTAKQDPQPSEVNEDNFVDGWNIVDEPVICSAKDHGISGRGKSNPIKGHRGSGNAQHFGSKYHRGAEAEADHYSETSQGDRPSSSKGKNVTQWQPKSQTVSNEGDKNFKRDTSGNSGSNLKQHVEKKAVPTKDAVDSGSVEHTDGTKNVEHPSSSGNRRNGNHNGRFVRGKEFHGDRSFNMQENRQNYAPANQEKQRQNSRYEYQPVRQENFNRRGNNLEEGIENQHYGSRFRDQHHMRRGGDQLLSKAKGKQSD